MSEHEKIPASERIHSVITKTKLHETLESRQKLRDWAEHLSFQDFLDIITGLNNMVRQKSVKPLDRKNLEQSVAGVGHIFTDPIYIAPHQKDREALLRKTFEAGRALILNKREQDAALLFYMALQSIHPFEDGNGRTGRAMYLLLCGPITDAGAGGVRETMKSYIVTVSPPSRAAEAFFVTSYEV